MNERVERHLSYRTGSIIFRKQALLRSNMESIRNQYLMNNQYGIYNQSGGDSIHNQSGGDSIDNQSITRPQPLIRSRLRERLRMPRRRLNCRRRLPKSWRRRARWLWLPDWLTGVAQRPHAPPSLEGGVQTRGGFGRTPHVGFEV